MKYESFSIRIEPSPGSSYTVSVQSPQGEGQVGEIRELIAPSSTPSAPALDIGKDLYRTLFKDEVASLFHTNLGGLRGQNRGLRINISINPRCPELASFQKLPW